MNPVVIVKAMPGDAPEVGRILSNWIDETPWMPRVHTRVDEQDFAGDLVARGWVHVAKLRGQVVGFLARDKVELHALYLAEEARGQGIGRVFLQAAKAKVEHLQLWVFQSNTAAQRFYLREGFLEIARSNGSTNDEGLPDIRYEWRRQHG